MKPVTIFHGPNNSGKSNILAFLEFLFSKKQTTLPAAGEPAPTSSSFWNGILLDFKDNFYRGSRDEITFSVTVRLEHRELTSFHEDLKLFNDQLTKDRDKFLTISGRISPMSYDSARMSLDEVRFQGEDDTSVLYRRTADGAITFFPALESTQVSEAQKRFERYMDILTDRFSVIHASRYFDRENQTITGDVELTPSTFKRWLLQQSMGRDTYSDYQRLQSVFKTEPFAFGDLSFMMEDSELQVMVDQGWRQPVSRLGSGYQQILYLFAAMVTRRGKMLGLEEVEINLSPLYQKHMFESIKKRVFANDGVMPQVIVTSHSPYFGEHRSDVKCFEINHNGTETIQGDWTTEKDNEFFPAWR